MEEFENNEQNVSRDEIFSQTVRAGKRTYFFDVKATKSDEKYLTITESKRRFNNDNGKFFYEKHKIFLYQEDFNKFLDGLSNVIEFIQTGKIPPQAISDEPSEASKNNLSFEDLERDED